MNFSISDDPIEEEAEVNDEEVTLADDLLDEVTGDDAAVEDEVMEGFGIIPESGDEDEKEEKEEEDGDEELEEDAEDVAFDSFDDIDEL